jgi:hypothetical protein
MKMKLAVEGRSGTEFVAVTADDAWLKKHATGDDAETAALAMRHADRGMQLYRLAMGDRKRPTSVELTTSISAGSVQLINPEVLQPVGASCFICLCDEDGCICVPC